MTFRQINQAYLIPGFQTLMILGIIALCQPWSEFFHRYGLTIIIAGLIGFIITTHIKPEPEEETDLIEDALDTLELNRIDDHGSDIDRTGRR